MERHVEVGARHVVDGQTGAVQTAHEDADTLAAFVVTTNLDAERSVLGAVLLTPVWLNTIARLWRELEAERQIWRVVA